MKRSGSSRSEHEFEEEEEEEEEHENEDVFICKKVHFAPVAEMWGDEESDGHSTLASDDSLPWVRDARDAPPRCDAAGCEQCRGWGCDDDDDDDDGGYDTDSEDINNDRCTKGHFV